MDCDGETLMRDARCLCIHEGLQMQVLISLFCKILNFMDPMQACDGETLMREARCICIQPGEQLPVLILLTCKLVQLAEQGGVGGGGGVTCGNGPPTDTPSSGCGIYTDNISGAQYNYNPVYGGWVLKMN